MARSWQLFPLCRTLPIWNDLFGLIFDFIEVDWAMVVPRSAAKRRWESGQAILA
ncbi:MAG: hypothetical protein AAGB19_22660 [Cyanobacteria bacterium P01_F01_bin.3]